VNYDVRDNFVSAVLSTVRLLALARPRGTRPGNELTALAVALEWYVLGESAFWCLIILATACVP